MALRVSPQFLDDRPRYADVLKRHERRIAKTVDLFSRIKNTSQSEEVLTVLFAGRELKQLQPNKEVAEQELFDYILNWKKAWRSDEKKQALAGAIRHLVLLGWMRLSLSDSFQESC